jgi:hypothetical protein
MPPPASPPKDDGNRVGATAPAAKSKPLKQKVYYTWCPVGGCTKGGQHLGRSFTEYKARHRVYDHLFGSPYHQYDHDAATKAADDCEVESVDEDVVDDEEGWVEPPARKRPPPPEPTGQPPGSMLKRQAAALSCGPSASRSSASSDGAVAIVMTDLTQAIQQQTRNAYIFVKARLAFRSFLF